MFTIQPYRRRDIETRFDSWIDEFFNNDFFSGLDASFSVGSKSGYPRIDIQELPEKFIIDATVPGLTKEDVKIEVIDEDGQHCLSIRSDKKTETKESKRDFVRKEIHRSSFCRNITLPENVIEDKITALVKEGILTIEIPKKEQIKTLPKSKVVEIK